MGQEAGGVDQVLGGGRVSSDSVANILTPFPGLILQVNMDLQQLFSCHRSEQVVCTAEGKVGKGTDVPLPIGNCCNHHHSIKWLPFWWQWHINWAVCENNELGLHRAAACWFFGYN